MNCFLLETLEIILFGRFALAAHQIIRCRDIAVAGKLLYWLDEENSIRVYGGTKEVAS